MLWSLNIGRPKPAFSITDVKKQSLRRDLALGYKEYKWDRAEEGYTKTRTKEQEVGQTRADTLWKPQLAWGFH